MWDAKHPQHYNKILKNDAWVELATALHCSIDDGRKKMPSLLASLRREKVSTTKVMEPEKVRYLGTMPIF